MSVSVISAHKANVN